MTPRTDLSRMRAPVAEAHGLPDAYYTDPGIFAEERVALIFSQWAGLGVAADAPQPGDAKPLDFLGMPLLLLRDEAGVVRVFRNICRHRGMILVDAPRRIEEAMANLIARRSAFDLPLYHGGHDSRFTLEVATNRKPAVKNYCESYHLPWVHPGLNSHARLEDHYHIEPPGAFSGQGTMIYRQLTNETGDTFPDFVGVGAKWNERAEYVAAYPDVRLGAHRDHAFAIMLEPNGPERTVEHIHLYYPVPDADESLKMRNTQLWKTVFEEDISVVEGMQRSRHAMGFDGGRFSPVMDSPTHGFHDWVAGRVAAHRVRAQAAGREA